MLYGLSINNVRLSNRSYLGCYSSAASEQKLHHVPGFTTYLGVMIKQVGLHAVVLHNVSNLSTNRFIAYKMVHVCLYFTFVFCKTCKRISLEDNFIFANSLISKVLNEKSTWKTLVYTRLLTTFLVCFATSFM